MKKLVSILLTVFICAATIAQQGVAINTDGSTPNTSALLDVQSTTKGMLIPRMTTIQRLLIPPAKGLLVFDNSTSSFWFHNGSGWEELLSGTPQWNNNGSNITNSNAGNVGIGVTSPTQKLHVNGNILSTGRVDANGVIEGSGLSSIGLLYVGGSSQMMGAVTGSSTASFAGNINSNTSMSINDATATLQLKSAGVDKGFVQLSGDNLRIGTNSSNTNGNVVVRTQGADQIRMNDAGIDLVNNGELNRQSTGSANLVPAAYGTVKANGTIARGTGNFTVVRTAPGIYEITVTGLTNAVPIVTCSFYQYTVTAYMATSTKLSVNIWDAGFARDADSDFHFVVFNF